MYRRLGFTLTPRGFHTLGSMNHLAVFGTEYLELIAVPPTGGPRAELLTQPVGLNGLVFGMEDADATYAALVANGVDVGPPNNFSRPVDLPGGPRDAAFRTVRLPSSTTEAGRLYFCEHKTRDLVWRDEWRHHANGVIGIERAIIAAAEPAALGALFARMFGAETVKQRADALVLAVGLSRFEIVKPAFLAGKFGDAAPTGDGRAAFMAALTLRTRSLTAAADALRAGGIPVLRGDDDIVVPASAAFGVTLEFRQ